MNTGEILIYQNSEGSIKIDVIISVGYRVKSDEIYTPSQSYTLASRSKILHTNQNLPKSMPAPTHGGQDIAAKFKEKKNERQ